MSQPLILAIDTSCDETAAAVSKARSILSNVIHSQIDLHRQYGGVVPHLAKRAHQEKIATVINTALTKARVKPDQLQAIAVTLGPGLAPALEVGINQAKNLAKHHHKPLIPINHMQGHLLSSLALNSKANGPIKKITSNLFPALGLLVSGGHTQLVLVTAINHYQLLGQTLDDAAGEALDKLAKMLKLGYPGGPIIEQLAKKGNPNQITLPIPLQHSPDLNFSFSGLKTAAMYLIKDQKNLTKNFTYNLCASFQQAIANSLTIKLTKAITKHQPKTILLGGGVISNLFIRRQIYQAIKPFNLPSYIPYSNQLLTDNAAMICIPAYFKYQAKHFSNQPQSLDRQPRLSF